MYLHLGQDIIVRLNDVVGIFDIETTTISKHTRDFLKKAQDTGKIINVTEELPNSFIVCNGKENNVVYLSQISSATLLKRADFISDITNI